MNHLLKGIFASFAFINITFAQSELITFDDLSGSGYIPPNYAGLQWSSDFWYLNAVQFEQIYGITGLNYGLISGTEVAVNGYGVPVSITSSQLFDLTSAYLTAAFNDGMQLEVKGFADSTLLYDNTYTLSVTRPLLITFEYLGINEVDFVPSFNGDTSNFVMDNLLVSIPEPNVINFSICGAIIIIFGAPRLRQLPYLLRIAHPKK
ncbi:MAG: hypothetical protein ABSD29_12550 [Verrucomicrobiota bacterium]|jgi:hypothetical protein